MSVETHRVLIGACGWKHQAWLNDFYEEDLPEEWQLGFYSNEFSVVYVPTTDWFSESEEVDFAEWVNDVSDSFRFVLEISEHILKDEQRFAAALNKAKDLGDFCLGLVFQISTDILNDIPLFQKHLKSAQAIAPVCVDKCGTQLTTETSTILQKENISEVWHGDLQEHESLKRGLLAISLVSSEALEPVGLRKVVEVCLSVSSDGCISVLCFDDQPPSLQKLRNADIILNLL